MTCSDLTGKEGVAGLDNLKLPENYVHRALGVFQGYDVEGMFVPWIKSADSETIPKIKASVLADVDQLKAQFDTDELSWLGALTKSDKGAAISTKPTTSRSGSGAAKALGIIDVGFAFWNDRFLVEGTSVFDDLGFFDMNSASDIWLGSDGLADLLRDTDPTYRNQVIRNAFGERFPQSIYAASERGLSIYAPSGFNHGTAMADLALPDDQVPTFALELPSEALLDSSGELLEATLIPAIRELHNRMMSNPNVTDQTDKIILLAFGYPGGPHDTTRPIVQALKAELATMKTQLVIPTGNHLQDRCHAHWELSGNTPSEPLPWVFEIEDYSSNHVSLHYDAARPDVTLTDPLGTTITWASGDDRLVKIIGRAVGQDTDSVLGLALDSPDTKGGGCIDLILAPTAGDDVTCRAGRWMLQFAGGSTKVDGWISRDDMSIPDAIARRRKQSWFEDDSYEIYGQYGRMAQTDQVDARIKRAGTASALSTFAPGEPQVHIVGAGQETFDGVSNADYSGLPYNGKVPELELVHAEIGSAGVLALGNGSITKFRVSGSSAAAALRAKSLLDA